MDFQCSCWWGSQLHVQWGWKWCLFSCRHIVHLDMVWGVKSGRNRRCTLSLVILGWQLVTGATEFTATICSDNLTYFNWKHGANSITCPFQPSGTRHQAHLSGEASDFDFCEDCVQHSTVPTSWVKAICIWLTHKSRPNWGESPQVRTKNVGRPLGKHAKSTVPPHSTDSTTQLTAPLNWHWAFHISKETVNSLK